MDKEKEVISQYGLTVGLTGLQAHALDRYNGMLDLIRKQKEVQAQDLYADMFVNYGCVELTVARYLRVAQHKGFIIMEGKTIKWKNIDVQ